MSKTIRRVSVFGGATPQPDSSPYQDAYLLGSLLAQAGLTVMTGGYGGAMEAVSKGAAEHNGHVIGVTSDEIEAYRPSGPNQWVDEEWRCPTFKERLDRLIQDCDAAIAVPGGLGTLVEISLTWNQLLIGIIEPKPLILMGAGWRQSFEVFFETQGNYIPKPSRDFLQFAENPPQAVGLLSNLTDQRTLVD